MSTRPAVSERAIVFMIGAIQFVNILDFVMVMPLGPDFARGLGIPTSEIGTIGAAYTAAGSVAGVAAGLFGGPATSLSLSIIADLIPVERRGRAMGAVMGAFSVASVVGIPAALKLSAWGGWRLPFFVVAGLGLLLVAGAIFFLPPVRGHLEPGRQPVHRVRVRELFSRTDVLLSYSMTLLLNAGSFVVIPNIAAYVQNNLGAPRTQLESIYLVGGLVSFVTLRVAGKLVDRLGSFRMGTVGSLLFIATLYFSFLHLPAGVSLVVIYAFFFLSNGVRNVAYSTLTSRVPEQAIRARFMSFQSAVQHLGAATGAFVSSRLLVELPGGALAGMERVVGLSIVLTLGLPLMLFLVERRVLARDRLLSTSSPGLAA